MVSSHQQVGSITSPLHSGLALLFLWRLESAWSASSRARPELRCPSSQPAPTVKGVNEAILGLAAQPTLAD